LAICPGTFCFWCTSCCWRVPVNIRQHVHQA
jgi:hypothetical protein